MTLRTPEQVADDYIQGEDSDIPIDDEDRQLTVWEDVKIVCSIRDAEIAKELRPFVGVLYGVDGLTTEMYDKFISILKELEGVKR